MEPILPQSFAITITALFLWWGHRLLTRRNYLSKVPGPRRVSWWKGNFTRFFSTEAWEFHEELYRGNSGVARLDMLFGEQMLYVSDPLALNHICIKDQDVYEEAERFLETNRLLFGSGLLSSVGNEHRRQRKLLNPAFSLANMRNLLPIFYPIAHKLCDVLETEVAKSEGTVDIMNWASRAALEYIGQGSLGYTFDALNEQRTNGYSEAMKAVQPVLHKLGFLLLIIHKTVKIGSASFRRRVVEQFTSGPIRDFMNISDTIEKHSKEILRGKRQALKDGDEAVHAQIGEGKDILSILMKAATIGEANRFPESELLAHMSTFIVAGHDTTTSAVCRILHTLSEHQDTQTMLREEVTAARKEYGDLDYDTLMALPLLDAICRETMRVYPPVSHLDRVAREDTILPLKWPILSSDGKTEINELHVRKGTGIFISILGANRCKVIWGADAEEWKPERWLKRLPKSVDDAHLPGVYSQMMTFLGGARACIGFKFSETEMKVVLSLLIEKFIFEPGPNEIYWATGQLTYPVVKGDPSRKAQAPLKMTVIGK